jgi:lipoprotein-anchoring transpeptidase ErfK/SrfK
MSVSMSRKLALSLAALLFTGNAALAQTPRMVMAAPPPPQMQSELGGGFIEFLFGAHNVAAPPPSYAAPPPSVYGPPSRQRSYANLAPAEPMPQQRAPAYHIDPQFLRQEVDYHGKEAPGTLVVDTPHHFLYLVEANGKAMRYGIGVARSGFEWSGVHEVTAKKEWPDWFPPKEMIERQPYLPHRMAGGPNNPLGARALYIGHTLYRIHGSNEPWTIGHNVSSGCIRMRNADVIDLYSRVKVGTKVVVVGPHGSDKDYIPAVTTDPTKVEKPS